MLTTRTADEMSEHAFENGSTWSNIINELILISKKESGSMVSKIWSFVDHFKVNIGPCMGLSIHKSCFRYYEWGDFCHYTRSFLNRCERSSVKGWFWITKSEMASPRSVRAPPFLSNLYNSYSVYSLLVHSQATRVPPDVPGPPFQAWWSPLIGLLSSKICT
jgi:hypothetical protein